MANLTGKKFGGRKKGTPNKRTAALREQVAYAINNVRVTPLECLLDVTNGATHYTDLQIDAAKAAAPYVHARKVQSDDSVTLKTDEGNALVEIASAVTEVLGRLKKRNEAPSE